MADDYTSYLQSQLAALRDASSLATDVLDPEPEAPAPPVVAAPVAPAALVAPAPAPAPPPPTPPRPQAPSPSAAPLATPAPQVAPPAAAPTAPPTPVAPAPPSAPPPPASSAPHVEPPPAPAVVPQYASPVAPEYAAPQYAAPLYAAPQYAAPQYAAPQYAAPQYAPPPPPTFQVPPRRAVPRWVALVTAVAMLAIAAAGWTGAKHLSAAGPSHPARWDARVEPIVHFVERERGLTFKHPVAVDFLTPAAFKAKMGSEVADNAGDTKVLEHAVAQARALGLLHGNVDLKAMTAHMTEEDVIGVYEPSVRRVFVRGNALTPDVRVTLAHELTHALQDQYFRLGEGSDTNADDSASRALIEGDAMRVESAYGDQLTPQDREAYAAAMQAGSDQAAANTSDVPEALTAPFEFPYIFGPEFVHALVQAGGNAAVDAALRKPPRTDAEVIDPQRYLDHVAPVIPKAPGVASGEKRLDAPGPFGEMTTLQMVGSTVGYVRAWNALAGWRGDVAQAFTRAGTDCVTVVTAFDTPDHAAAFASASQDWAAGAEQGAVLQTGSHVQLQACDPGADAPPPASNGPSAIDVLQMRAALIHVLTTAESPAPLGVATCVADQSIAKLGPDAFVKVMQTDDASAIPASARQAIVGAAATCKSAK